MAEARRWNLLNTLFLTGTLALALALVPWRLAAILMHPDDYVPRAMVDALYYVHEMSDEDAFDDLVAIAKQHGVPLDPEVSAGDVAIELWLRAPESLQKAHAEASASRMSTTALQRMPPLRPATRSNTPLNRPVGSFFGQIQLCSKSTINPPGNSRFYRHHQ